MVEDNDCQQTALLLSLQSKGTCNRVCGLSYEHTWAMLLTIV